MTVCYDESMSTARLRRVLSSALLAVAYLSCIFQWLWVAILGLPALIDSGTLDLLTTVPEPAPVQVPDPTTSPSPLVWIFVGVTTLVILALTIIVLIRLPKTISRAGEQVVRTTTEVVLPVITHHKQLPAKKRVVLSRRIMLIIRLTLCTVPFVISMFIVGPGELTRQIIITVATTLGIVSVFGFIGSWLLEPVATSRTRSRVSRG